VIVAVVIANVIVQARTPLSHFDDRMYRASRAAYWLENRSILPWETHNDRQVAFPFGSELMFFWPVLMTRSEAVGRTVFALVAPLCAIGAYLVAREALVSRTAALAGALLLVVTPQVAQTFTGLSPESWLALFALGAAFFALRAARQRGRAARVFVMIGVFVALAMNVKATAIALVPVALVLPWLVARGGGASRWSRMKAIAAGGAVGAALSGITLLLAGNFLREGHPLGPPMMVAVHSADLSPRQVRTHVARFLVAMIDLPVDAGRTVQTRLTESGRAFLATTGADQPITLEKNREQWPGTYSFDAGDGSLRYSTGGMMWVIALAAATAAVIADLFKHRGNARLGSAGVLAWLSLSMLAFTLLTIRWMGQVERFWVAAYALGVPLIVVEVSRVVRRRRWLRYVVTIVLAITAIPTVRGLARAVATPSADATRLVDEPFVTTLHHIPPGSRILLVASQAVRDYPLFAPRRGYANEVHSWGNEPFTPQRLAAVLDEHDITHVVLESDAVIAQHWRPYLRTVEMTQWLRRRRDWEEVARGQTSMPLFVRRSGGSSAPTRSVGSAPATAGYNGTR
jgi:hypothetical protein